MRVARVRLQQEPRVEEHVFRLHLGHAPALVLARVARVPVEADDPTQRKLRMRTTSRLSLPAETTRRRLSGIQRTEKTSVDVS